MQRRPKEVWKAAMPLPQPVRLLHQAFAAAGHKLHVVGGAVRDFMVAQLRGLSFEPKDFDLVTAAVPDVVEAILRTGRAKGALPRNIDIRTVGKAFGVILVSFRDGDDFEIATFREDGPGGGRRPDAVTFSTMPEDADRRDLTINALYYSIDDQEVIDFHGGIQHLRDNVVVFVGEPGQRLREDRLRALRFVRFHGRVNPGGPDSLDPAARAAIRLCILRPVVSDERIRDEFIKGLQSVLDVPNFVTNLADLGLLAQVFPGLALSSDPLFWKDALGERLSAVLIIAQLLKGNQPKKAATTLSDLKYTSAEADDVWFLLKLPEYAAPERVVDFKRDASKKTIGDELVSVYAHQSGLANAELIDQMQRFPYPNIRGEEVMAEGFRGPALGREMRNREVAAFVKFLGKNTTTDSTDNTDKKK